MRDPARPLETLSGDDLRACLEAAGLDGGAWCGDLARTRRTGAAAPEALDADAAQASPVFRRGWELLDALPVRSQRSAAERQAGEALVGAMADLCRRLCRAHRETLYRRLTDDFARPMRVDELLWAAAERWSGLVPTGEEVAEESRRRQMDKDGREIQQGVLVGQMLGDPRIGHHLCQSMLQPTTRALELLARFEREGSLDLGTMHVEARGETGHVTFQYPQTLNAEDDSTIAPLEVAIDLVLLHPGLRMGVLRGCRVQHPKYADRRVFSSGINLTQLYEGQVSYLFYLVRDLGLVNKLFRGLATERTPADEPETTLEKPWVAVVDTFAIGGGCQLLLVMDYVIAEEGAYFNLPARKEGIIPGAANLRLPRFLGERLARQAIMFDTTFSVDSPQAAAMINEVHPRDALDDAVERCVANALGSGMVSAGGNRKALRVGTESLDTFRAYMATYAEEQARCHLSEQLVRNLERHWLARRRREA